LEQNPSFEKKNECDDYEQQRAGYFLYSFPLHWTLIDVERNGICLVDALHQHLFLEQYPSFEKKNEQQGIGYFLYLSPLHWT
jgi:hypothetical protein